VVVPDLSFLSPESFSPHGPTTITKTSQHYACALKSTLSDCVLGMHATPDSFRLSQRPLAATIPAPGSHSSIYFSFGLLAFQEHPRMSIPNESILLAAPKRTWALDGFHSVSRGILRCACYPCF